MKNLHAILIALALPFFSPAQYNSENLKIEANDKSSNAEPQKIKDYSSGNLKLFPIYANEIFQAAHRDMGKFTTLKEAQDKKQVTITEHTSAPGTNIAPTNIQINPINPNVNGEQVQTQNLSTAGSGATVNTLFVENISSDTVYIMAGEVVKGGKQNRVIAQDMVLPPNSGQVDLSVFCVEHGRWTTSSGDGAEQFKSSGYLATDNVRDAVELDKNQSKVWENVAATNAKNGTTSNSDALTANEDNFEFQNDLRLLTENPILKNLPSDAPNIVGVVAVTGNRVIACDIFATHQLFESQFQPLLHSYSSEAVTNGEKVTIADEKIQEYLDGFLKNEEKQVESLAGKGKVYNFQMESGKTVKTRVSVFK